MDPYIGEIRLFAGNYAPTGWAFCDGQVLETVQYNALFTVIGNRFGGDGDTTFALPDLRGRLSMHAGAGIGLTPRAFGETGGEAAVALTLDQIPVHDHAANCRTTSNGKSPEGAIWASVAGFGQGVYSTKTDVPMNAETIGVAGGGQPHNNMPPYVNINYMIALNGVYPSKP